MTSIFVREILRKKRGPRLGAWPSDYLLELARRNIEGEISMEEVDKLLDEYYEEKHKIRDTW